MRPLPPTSAHWYAPRSESLPNTIPTPAPRRGGFGQWKCKRNGSARWWPKPCMPRHGPRRPVVRLPRSGRNLGLLSLPPLESDLLAEAARELLEAHRPLHEPGRWAVPWWVKVSGLPLGFLPGPAADGSDGRGKCSYRQDLIPRSQRSVPEAPITAHMNLRRTGGVPLGPARLVCHRDGSWEDVLSFNSNL